MVASSTPGNKGPLDFKNQFSLLWITDIKWFIIKMLQMKILTKQRSINYNRLGHGCDSVYQMKALGMTFSSLWESEKMVHLCPTLCDPMDCSLPGFSVHGILQARVLRVGCHSLFQEIFPAQGLNPGLLHCRQILYRLRHQRKKKFSPALSAAVFVPSSHLKCEQRCWLQHSVC